MMHKISIFILLLALAACSLQAPTAEWTEGTTEANGQALHTLVLHNVPEGSRVWFQELFDGKTMVEGPAMHHYQGTSWYIDIPSNESLGRTHRSAPTVTLKYYGRPLPRQRWAPEAFILQQKGKPDMPMEVQYHFLELPPEEAISEDFACRYEMQPADIIPQIKRIQYGTEPMESTETHPMDGTVSRSTSMAIPLWKPMTRMAPIMPKSRSTNFRSPCNP